MITGREVPAINSSWTGYQTSPPFNNCLQLTFKSGRWSSIFIDRKGPLVLINGRMTAKQYLKRVLEDAVLPEMTSIEYNVGPMMFMHDGVPCHRAHIARTFFEKEGIPLMDWPACSPDLNPIENVWSRLKRAVNNRDYIPHTREELVTAIREEWEDIKVEHFSSMISNMPKRMQAC